MKKSDLDIGNPCNVTDPSAQCREGLLCSSAGIDNGAEVCQSTRSFGCSCTVDAQCDGGLCLDNSCDAVRSIGDFCTTDLHCGSVCVNQTCSLGSVNDKCNADKSCSTGFCAEDSTCQADTRENCSLSNPNGKCSGLNAVCFYGKCYSPNGDVGASCNASLSFPQCKVTLACLNGTCSKVAEGSPCTDRSVCNSLQDCVCSEDTSTYGCYTKIGASCATTYQALDDCLNQCTERQSIGVPGTCASMCKTLDTQYTCCQGCATQSTFFNYNGTCPSLVSQPCCSSTMACSEQSNDSVCPVTNPSTTSSSSVTFFSGVLCLGLLIAVSLFA